MATACDFLPVPPLIWLVGSQQWSLQRVLPWLWDAATTAILRTGHKTPSFSVFITLITEQARATCIAKTLMADPKHICWLQIWVPYLLVRTFLAELSVTWTYYKELIETYKPPPQAWLLLARQENQITCMQMQNCSVVTVQTILSVTCRGNLTLLPWFSFLQPPFWYCEDAGTKGKRAAEETGWGTGEGILKGQQGCAVGSGYYDKDEEMASKKNYTF